MARSETSAEFHSVEDSPHAASRFVATLRKARNAPSDFPDDDSLVSADPGPAPWRSFLAGAIVGCMLMTVPMAVLLWIAFENGILYTFYPLARTTE
mmetsp:Transcript_22636/g.61286  ORF Transcript_22636/g.61286 Transcript_22636/m.61286 type:complete len:96 (+) Transcript_22636:219-506(+)